MIITMLKNWLQRNSHKVRTIAIVGMHRSGTSLLTGSLQQAGLELHRFHEYNPHNKKGNRENQDIVELNTWLLDSNGGSWDHPPASIHWSQEQIARAQQIIAEYESYQLWGFKDPRFLITVAGWKPLLPQLEFVGIFRHPVAVARSLNARNEKISIDQGIELWSLYNSRLLALHRERPFPVLCFEKLLQEPGRQLQRVATQLQLPSPERINFFEAALVNQEVEPELPEEVAELHEKLRSIALP